ncbi:MAG TPA: PRC-barrel domain-containing protein [Roseimicrobium sp.]|nr:PRC-barrel domain-containing protein [Roseimicrobium sp.]
MLQDIKDLYGHALAASDGHIGHVKDFYFDDQDWAIRYLVVDTGTWLINQRVLLSPHSFGRWDRDSKTLHVHLTRAQIENSPSIETHQPVSLQYEEDYHRYYGWPGYWEGDAMWGMSGFPVMPGAPLVIPPMPLEPEPQPQHKRPKADRHLRSTKDVTGYHIQAADGALGSVSSFMVDDKSWAVAELVVTTGHWFSGKEILVSSDEVERISHEDSKVFVKLTMADIRQKAEHSLTKAGG